MSECDICGGRGIVSLRVIQPPLSAVEQFDDCVMPEASQEASRPFDCPQCVKKVPYRRVKAVKIVQKVDAQDFGKYQNPIERGLAQQFGTYMMREGLIKFGMEDDPADGSRVFVVAAINIVSQKDARIAGAEEYVAETDATPKLPRNRRPWRDPVEITSGYTMPWSPEPAQVFKPPQSRRERIREAAEKVAGVNNRFNGIDLGDFDDD